MLVRRLQCTTHVILPLRHRQEPPGIDFFQPAIAQLARRGNKLGVVLHGLAFLARRFRRFLRLGRRRRCETPSAERWTALLYHGFATRGTFPRLRQTRSLHLFCLVLRQHARHLIAPMLPRRDRQHQPVFPDRSATRLTRKPPRRRLITRADALLPENMHARSSFWALRPRTGSKRQRHKPHRLPKPIGFDILRAPAAIQPTPIRASLELRL